MDKVKESLELVDIILDGEYDNYKNINKVDDVLDEIENQIDTVPDQDLEQLSDDVVDELSKDSNAKHKEEVKERTIEDNMKEAVQLLIKEEDYREFFKSMLKKWNISSPSDLEGEKKKEFFDAVDKGWKAKKETD